MTTSRKQVRESNFTSTRLQGKRRGWIIVFHNGPKSKRFDEWLHYHHFPRIKKLEGVESVSRLSILEGDKSQRYIALIQSEDINATIRAVKSDVGKDLIKSAGDNGVADREFFFCSSKYVVE